MTKHAIEVVTGPDTLSEIQRILDEALSAEDVTEHTKMCIDLAVSEIGTNIIEYSRDGQPVKLRMEVEVATECITVTFTDDGPPEPVDLTRIAMSEEAAEHGRGLAIANRVLDELSYLRDSDKISNHWTLKRRRSE